MAGKKGEIARQNGSEQSVAKPAAALFPLPLVSRFVGFLFRHLPAGDYHCVSWMFQQPRLLPPCSGPFRKGIGVEVGEGYSPFLSVPKQQITLKGSRDEKRKIVDSNIQGNLLTSG